MITVVFPWNIQADMFDIVNPTKQLSCSLVFFKVFFFLQGIVRGGINVTTVDPADIRGLGTAWLDFVVRLPLSNNGSSVNALS